jgi:hypothetical protein
MSRNLTSTLLVLAALAAAPPMASAQGFALGPRMSFVRGDVPSGTPSTRFLGGTVRVGSSKHVAFELALDYRSETSEDGLSRLRERPFQGSMLVFPVRSTVAPYLLAGYGIYQQTYDTLDPANGLALSSTVSRKSGAHIGFGAEVLIIRHAAFYIDYRLRFVRFGSPEGDEDPVDIPGQSVIPGLKNVQLSHQGSMITSGVAFYF